MDAADKGYQRLLTLFSLMYDCGVTVQSPLKRFFLSKCITRL